MLEELKIANEKIISIMKSKQDVLGGWYFGSISHEMSDDYSDIDIVFLIDDNSFENLGKVIADVIAPAVDKVILCWAEVFNNERIKNYDCLLMLNEKVFQYDIFLLNKKYIDDYMCKLHYNGLQEKNIIFDIAGDVRKLMNGSSENSVWYEDINRIIETYWLHIQMSTKYFLRNDFFKLEGVLRILMDTHTSLLLTGYDKINWGGTANKLHFIDYEKKKHLMRYGCVEDLKIVRKNLLQSILWFEEDVKEIGSPQNQKNSNEIGEVIKQYWISNTENI